MPPRPTQQHPLKESGRFQHDQGLVTAILTILEENEQRRDELVAGAFDRSTQPQADRMLKARLGDSQIVKDTLQRMIDGRLIEGSIDEPLSSRRWTARVRISKGGRERLALVTRAVPSQH